MQTVIRRFSNNREHAFLLYGECIHTRCCGFEATAYYREEKRGFYLTRVVLNNLGISLIRRIKASEVEFYDNVGHEAAIEVSEMIDKDCVEWEGYELDGHRDEVKL